MGWFGRGEWLSIGRSPWLQVVHLKDRGHIVVWKVAMFGGIDCWEGNWKDEGEGREIRVITGNLAALLAFLYMLFQPVQSIFPLLLSEEANQANSCNPQIQASATDVSISV